MEMARPSTTQSGISPFFEVRDAIFPDRVALHAKCLRHAAQSFV
jgi:hypothetical protein